MEGQIDQHTDGGMDGWMDGQTDEWMEGWMDAQMDGVSVIGDATCSASNNNKNERTYSNSNTTTSEIYMKYICADTYTHVYKHKKTHTITAPNIILRTLGCSLMTLPSWCSSLFISEKDSAQR